MSKRSSERLFLLIKSLNKAEKRIFKFYASRGKNTGDEKFIRLFDFIDKQEKYDEKKILKQAPDLKKVQLSNLKAHLYQSILESLELYNSEEDIEIQLRHSLNQINILYNRALYEQCHKIIAQGKKLAQKYDKILLLFEFVEFEKKLLTKSIEKDIHQQAIETITQSEELATHIRNTRRFQNLSLKLYAYYLQIGFIRNSRDFDIANRYLYSSLPAFKEEELSFNEKMFLYQSFTGYYYFVQDAFRAYDYAQKWLLLFNKNPNYIQPKFEYYLKAFNNVVAAQFRLSYYDDFIKNAKQFSELKNLDFFKLSFNHKLLIFKYSTIHLINSYFMTGEFTKGAKAIPDIYHEFKIYESKLDKHSRTIFYYKFACMYFGDDNYTQTIYWLNKIINDKDDSIRSDIQGFSRILILLSHWELKNNEFIEYFMRSTIRYLKKIEDFHLFQKYMLEFIRDLGSGLPEKIDSSLNKLYKNLKPLQGNPYEKRAFAYFDILSWLESKLQNKSNQLIIHEKAKRKIERVRLELKKLK